MEKIKLYRPVPKKFRISSGYGWRTDPLTKQTGKFHKGYDFATPVGTPITPMASGHIVKVGWENQNNHDQGFGFRIMQKINLAKVYFLTYAHLSQAFVDPGHLVTARSVLGYTGNTGKSSGPHIHVGARLGDTWDWVDIEWVEPEQNFPLVKKEVA